MDLGIIQTHSLWAPALGQQLARAPVTYGEKLKYPAAGQVPGNSFLWDKTSEAKAAAIVPFLSLLPNTEPPNRDTISETPTNWFPQVALPW